MSQITGSDFYFLISSIATFGSISILGALFRRLF